MRTRTSTRRRKKRRLDVTIVSRKLHALWREKDREVERKKKRSHASANINGDCREQMRRILFFAISESPRSDKKNGLTERRQTDR